MRSVTIAIILGGLGACGASSRSPTAPAGADDPRTVAAGDGVSTAGDDEAPGATMAADAEEDAPMPAAAARRPSPGAAPAGPAAQFLAAHNQLRAAHCAPPLAWSAKLEAVAQRWADHLRDGGCLFEHSRTPYGENLAGGTIGALDPASTVAMWADEEKLYRFPDGGFSMQTGHFTQEVWKATREVGCGHVTCKGNDIWVCNYAPAGNVEGEYRANVSPAGCRR